MKPLILAAGVAILLAGCHWHTAKPAEQPPATVAAPAATPPAPSAPAPLTLVPRPGDIALGNVKCGELISRVNRDAHTHTVEIQTMLTWIFGYASAMNGVDTIRTSAAGPFFDQLRADCQSDPGQSLLPLAIKSAAAVINAPIAPPSP
jgi:hypothetical protein